jgi:hypothetical protein
MVASVSKIAVQRIYDTERLVPDRDCSKEIGWGECRECVEADGPPFFPPPEEHISSNENLLEFFVSVPARLLAVGSQKVCPAGAQVAFQMMHDHSNAIRAGGDGPDERVVGTLGKGAFTESFVLFVAGPGCV